MSTPPDQIVAKKFYVYGRQNARLRALGKRRGVTQQVLLEQAVELLLAQQGGEPAA